MVFRLPAAALVKSLCTASGVDCLDLLTAITGKNCCLNSSTVDLFLKNEPQPTSTKNLVHLAQSKIIQCTCVCTYAVFQM